ncbi:MAG: hypothetical protein GY834_09905 [Bacteroidetes bacterium]|nr:hypothetical protein [Bacteroidota bacterium]
MIEFQYYPAKVKAAKPMGEVTIDDFVKAVKNPSDEIKDVFKRIAEAEAADDMDLKSKLKQENLFYFTPCVFFDPKGVQKKGERGIYTSYRCYENIKHFTGLAVLDFDHINFADELRDYVFKKYKCVIAAFVSSSKRGVKFIVKIPVVKTTDDFKAYFYGLGCEFDKYKGFDGTAQNSVLPLFLSYDPDIKFRDNPETWNVRGSKLDSFVIHDKVIPIDFKVKEGDPERIYKNIKKAFDAIVDNGHPQVIAACVSLGGYVSTGYISQQDAEQMAEALIKSNTYLQKGIAGYIKTSKTAIQTGMQSNLILK